MEYSYMYSHIHPAICTDIASHTWLVVNVGYLANSIMKRMAG